ncbi:FecR family protein [Butyricimonas synergistica]|uniref:FecR family protein n=1 Tax=Butyricimonas synergistica TaxID=544644 RepID=UPI00039A1619|nr:FecR domain-containing protein [Butyricimonas synergistica]
MQDKRIYQLIAKQLVEGLNEEEKQELNDWIAEPGNDSFYQEITEKEYVKLRLEKWSSIDVKKHTTAFEKEIGIKPVRRVSVWWQYAAAVVIFCVIGIGFWMAVGKDAEVKKVAGMDIVPGETKAVLVLNDGRQVDLGVKKVDRIIEKDGKVIMNDSLGINYNQESGEQGVGLKNEIIVPTGGEYNLILSDGTIVYLNAESRIEFPVKFSGKERVVTLVGEAYFQVTASKEHPFIVKTKDMDVLVTGTEFNVKAYPDELEVQTTLLKGEVTVFAGFEKKEKMTISPNQQAQWDREHVALEVREVDPGLFMAWRNGRFIFRQDRLEDIMRTLARWYGVEVVFSDESIKNMTFAGKLDRSEDIAPILDVLRATGKLTVNVKGKQIVLGVK